MKRISIIDVTTLTLNENIYGHFLNLAENYKEALEDDFRVYILGGKTYGNFIDKDIYIELPFRIIVGERSICNKIKEFFNGVQALRKDSDIYIFQCYSDLPILLALTFFKLKKRKIFIIQYKKLKEKFLIKLLFKVNKEKINGVICPSMEVGRSYKLPHITISDYLYINDKFNKNKIINYKRDFLIIGTMSEGKDLEMIVNSLKDSNFKITIIGDFKNKTRFRDLNKYNSKNIIIIDKYLSSEEYDEYIQNSKYIILPYKEIYNDISSGVVLDSIYRRKPVIVPDLKSFKFVKENNLGLVYKYNINEIIDTINEENYGLILTNIEKYLCNLERENKELINFIKNA